MSTLLPDPLVAEMRDASGRSGEFPDLGTDHAKEKGEAPAEKLGNLTQEDLVLLQRLPEKMNTGKANVAVGADGGQDKNA